MYADDEYKALVLEYAQKHSRKVESDQAVGK